MTEAVAARPEALQAWLQGAIMAAEPPSGEEVGARLVGADDFPAAAGLAVYRRAYVARIAAAMRAQFPALCHALGERLFNDFAAEYLHTRPPESYTLHDLGRRFAAFLEEQRPDRGAPAEEREIWIDFMVDLARFERQLFLLFDAPGAEGGALAGPGTPDARLRLQPAVALGRYDFNVAAWHDAVRRRDTPPARVRGATFVALVRRDYAIRTVALRESEYLFLEAMIGDGSVADGFAALAASLGVSRDEAGRAWRAAPQTRARWLQWGFFVEAACD